MACYSWFGGFLALMIMVLFFVPLPAYGYGIIAGTTTLLTIVFVVVAVHGKE